MAATMAAVGLLPSHGAVYEDSLKCCIDSILTIEENSPRVKSSQLIFAVGEEGKNSAAAYGSGIRNIT